MSQNLNKGKQIKMLKIQKKCQVIKQLGTNKNFVFIKKTLSKIVSYIYVHSYLPIALLNLSKTYLTSCHIEVAPVYTPHT